jgi:hypothetical protein
MDEIFKEFIIAHAEEKLRELKNTTDAVERQLILEEIHEMRLIIESAVSE